MKFDITFCCCGGYRLRRYTSGEVGQFPQILWQAWAPPGVADSLGSCLLSPEDARSRSPSLAGIHMDTHTPSAPYGDNSGTIGHTETAKVKYFKPIYPTPSPSYDINTKFIFTNNTSLLIFSGDFMIMRIYTRILQLQHNALLFVKVYQKHKFNVSLP